MDVLNMLQQQQSRQSELNHYVRQVKTINLSPKQGVKSKNGELFCLLFTLQLLKKSPSSASDGINDGAEFKVDDGRLHLSGIVRSIS